MVHLYSTLNKLCTELSNKNSYPSKMTKHRETRRPHPVVLSHSSSPLRTALRGIAFYLFTLLAFFYGWSFCSLIRNLESRESGPKAAEPKSTFHHSPNAYCCFSLPTPVQGRGCLCQPPATHALFGISINECTLGSCGPDQVGSPGEVPFLGLWEQGDSRSTLRPSNLLLVQDGKGRRHHHLWK